MRFLNRTRNAPHLPLMLQTAQRRFFGLHGSAKAWLIAKLQRETPQITVVCKDRKSAEELSSDLEFFCRGIPVLQFPAWDTLPLEQVSPQQHISAERIRALSLIRSSSPFVVVAAADSLSQKVLPSFILDEASFELSKRGALTHKALMEKLSTCGFHQVSLVEEVGEMSVRGSVIDFFPATSNLPIRVEFVEDKIHDIRTFAFQDQRSVDSLDSLFVLPTSEGLNVNQIPSLAEKRDVIIERLKHRAKELETPPRELTNILELLDSGEAFPGMELIFAIAAAPLVTYFDYLKSDAHVVIDDAIGLDQSLDEFYALLEEREERFRKEHYLIPTLDTLYSSPEEIRLALKNKEPTYIDSLEVIDENFSDDSRPLNLRTATNIELRTKLRTKVGTGEALKPLRDALKKWREKEFDIAFSVGSSARAERLTRFLLDLEVDAKTVSETPLAWMSSSKRYPVVIFKGSLSSGVQLPTEKVVFISENEIFSERSSRHATPPKMSISRLMSSLAQLKEDDYVVHSDYGVGLYHGLKHIAVHGVGSDFLHIEYADSRLYLPVHNIGKVQKFIASEGRKPVLDKLGSTRWVRTKQKVKESVASLAGDLIKLYAQRSVARGWRFEPYGAEDERFADGFAYDETTDQLKAIEETLGDMSTDKPMDRLVCGDVGFGKTEVAIRAAFKCIQHARQVAVLVPTTILVEQHKENFSKRFMGYPVEIGAMSRFYSAADNKKTLERISSGDLDIVIGTHKLLQKDVAFKDLGLLIIDEEHRFGVKQKERLKRLKTQVDVLTLTATPIPRTLHMSLLGIRDISVINSPPQDRRTIRTYIATHDESLIRDAILRELQRGGQCFFLHNRVQSIDLICAGLQQLVPEARFKFAHGQMDEKQLEKIMQDFLDKKIDVLVSTSIIESGLDIPNANTIIIDRADMFGLAQLYQLRGRVGRSARQAYAYLLVPKSAKLSGEAQKRLKVLQSLDDLGLGFNLALRDMEIRGAGNLLGKEQSGNVLAIGFELYTKILKEAVLNLKGEELSLEETVDPELKLGVNAYIPDVYIPDVSERLVLYQRLAALSSPEEASDLALEIEDRFGPMGKEAENFVELMRLRTLLRSFGVIKAEFAKSRLTLSFSQRAPIDAKKIIRLVEKEPNKYRFGKAQTLGIELEQDHIDSPAEIFPMVASLLEGIASAG